MRPSSPTAGKLSRYRSKRNFGRTAEPRGKSAVPGTRKSYVIQKHAARRLHYDFRLELGGVLKSWALPKGPSLDPADRRLAVHVEDHPIDYAGFEGVIPPKQYGAGTVMLWDRGTWLPHGNARHDYLKGRLGFELRGKHLNGGWVLVRMGGKASKEGRDNWLLIKERDKYARPGQGDFAVETVTRSAASGKTMAELGKRKSAKPAAVVRR
jgi:bifunctional non-homologous end joining protein LigD